MERWMVKHIYLKVTLVFPFYETLHLYISEINIVLFNQLHLSDSFSFFSDDVFHSFLSSENLCVCVYICMYV